MSWKCRNCNSINVNASISCVYCRQKLAVNTSRGVDEILEYDAYDEALFQCRVSSLDRYLPFILLLRLDRIININTRREDREEKMTPQEELFASFFNAEKAFVKDMSILELRAHREELAKIAFEARARLTAVDDEDRDRTAKKKTKGFSTSLQTDEVTTAAINTIKIRGERQSKAEKLHAGLVRLGIDPHAATQLMSAGTALAQIKKSQNATTEEIKIVTNPFASRSVDENNEDKKEQTISTINVTITENDSVIITKTEEIEKPAFVNPFKRS